jgi:PAS domain S-box-containing protein
MTEAAHVPDAQELLRLLLEQMEDHAILLLDADARVVGWLGGAERIFGYSAAEMVGQSAYHLFTPEDRALGLADHELEVARKDGRAEDDRWHVRNDGTRIWVNGVLVALRGADGRLVGFGKVLRDRTDVKAQIEALENRCEALARADERKNLFLGTLAHELRNPLAPLVNALEIIHLTAPAHPDLAYPVKLIDRQVEFIRRLVDDLLDITRIGAGKVQLKVERVSLNDVLARAAEACRPKAEARRQDLRVLVPALPILVDADSDRLRQVVANLLDNAVKYTPEGGGVWLKATVEGDEAVVRVEDNGVGITPEMLPRVFDLFTQEASSLGQAQGGLGLGLSLVKNLVALHGGTVQVRSEGKGKGSEFTVRLPLKRTAGGTGGADSI